MLAKHKQGPIINKNWYNIVMNSDKTSSTDFDRPVAYDVDGRPLYVHPSSDNDQSDTKTQVVHMTRPTEPKKPVISDATRLKHDRSSEVFPGLNLSEGEYVISAVRRHPIGLFIPLAVGFFLITLSFVVLFNNDIIVKSLQINGESINPIWVIVPVILFLILVSIGTYISYFVYANNKFFLTNESVIQEIQLSLFSKNEQTVSLADIEDASFTQIGIMQQVFNYGSIRLSTEGDETTYRFSYVANPKQHIAILNNAVEAFKNGRPVDGS